MAFKKLSIHLKAKYGGTNDLSRQLEIVKAFDLYKLEIKKIFPPESDIQPVSLKNGVLTVQVQSSIVANELRLLEKRVLEKMNEGLKKEAVSKIIYRF